MKDNIATKLMDSPIITCEEDCFWVRDYAEALTQFIEESNTPTVLSIEWWWGEWKTSLLNLIDEKLSSKEEKKFLHIRFDSWKFIFADDMNKAFLAFVLWEILKNNNWLKNILKHKAKEINIKSILSFIWKASISYIEQVAKIDLSNELDDIKNINIQGQDIRNSFKEIITNLIEESWWSLKIIISLDDLDRIQPIKAIEIIEIIKNFLDVDGVMFLLVVDKDIIKKWLSEKFNLPDDEGEKNTFFDLYFDKIIQLSFVLPKKDKDDDKLKKYIQNILKIDGLKIEDKFISIINDKRYFWANPRSIKRLANIYILKKIYYNVLNNEQSKNEVEQKKFDALFLSSLKAVNKSFSKDFDDEEDNNIKKKFSFVDSEIFNDIEKKTNVVNGNSDSYSNNEERLLVLIKENNWTNIRKEIKSIFEDTFSKSLDNTVIYNLLNKWEKNNFIWSIRKKYGLWPLLEETKAKKIKLTKDWEDFITNYLN